MTDRLPDKVAIISGGARGMGVAHARALVAAGARVLAFDLNEGDGPALAEELGDQSYVFTQGDVTISADWDRAVAICRERFGIPNVLVNNAGISPLHTLADVSEADYRTVIDVNQVGTFLGMRAVIPSLRESGGGSIINIASNAGCVGFAELISYVASKWAVRGMTKAAALELAADNIRVNAVCPGDTNTPMIRAFAGTGTAALPPASELPMQRWAEPEEVSAAVVFLASDESSYISGSDIMVDGAYTAQ